MIKKILPALIATLFMAVPALAAQSFDARSVGMGGIGASTANYLTAPFHNPALTARYTDADDIGILVPALGGALYDQDNIIDSIDDVSDVIDIFDADPTNFANADRVANQLTALQGDTASAQIGGALALAIPNSMVAVNVYTQTFLDASIYSDIDARELDPNFIFASGANSINSQATLAGIAVFEFGVALAKKYEFSKGTLYYGLTPKIQRVEAINYTANINNYETDDFDSDQYINSETSFNADAGVAYTYNGFTFGLVGTNLISQDYDAPAQGTTPVAVYSLNPVVTASVSYANDFFTVGLDVDLNETERFENIPTRFANRNADDDNSQMAGIGAEFNAWDIMQVRAGYQADLSNNIGEQFSLGLGMAIAETFSFDLAGTYGGDNQFGGALQFAFTF